MVIWYNSPIPVHLVRWFLECQRSLLPFPVWPLPICLDSWTWHFRFLGNIAFYSIGPCFHHQSNPHWVLFLFWLHPFILSGVIFHWSPVAYWAPTDLGSSSFSILSFCLFILFMGQEYCSGLAIPFSSGPHSVRPLHHDPPILGGPTGHGLVSLN